MWEIGEIDWNEDDDVRFVLKGKKTAEIQDYRLINAAHDLLKSLEKSNEFFENHWIEEYQGGEFHDLMRDIIDSNRAALAKAKGEV